MGNALRTPANLAANARNTVPDGANEGGHSPAENARHPENARLRASRRPTAREALAALFDPPSAPTFADSPRLAELIARHELGMVEPRAAARLAALFEANPPDVLDRLERACDHLGVTGDRAAELVNEAAARALEAQGHTPAGSPANTRTHERADLPTPERPNIPTRGDTSRNCRTEGTPRNRAPAYPHESSPPDGYRVIQADRGGTP